MKNHVENDIKEVGEEEKRMEEEREKRREKMVERGNWSGKLDFFLALCGSSVGLGNVWRFPYLCYKHGGGVPDYVLSGMGRRTNLPTYPLDPLVMQKIGAFLIPYFLSVFCAGIPLLVIEVGLGQFTGQGPVTAWGMISPLFKGIGCAGLVIQIFLDTYYVVIMAWGLYYLLFSFNTVLPYSTCTNDWNTPCCLDEAAKEPMVDVANKNMTTDIMTEFNGTMTTMMSGSFYDWNEECPNGTTSPTVEFWNRKVLQINRSDGIHDVGAVSWQLFLCLTLAWFLIYLCICKGVKSSGKVVYVTVPFPYILLTILLVRAVTLPNAWDGIIYYLKPDASKLKDSQVWLDAATQIFYSNTLGQGFLVALGSYNKRNHNFVRDTLLYSLTNSATSLYSGFVIFAVLGFMAGKQGKLVGEVAKSGPGLGFIAYPEAITEMPLSTLWAILFFLCLLFLGIDSVFVVVEGFVTTIVDIFPKTLLKGHRREFFCAGCCLFFCMAGIPMVTYGGMYIFQLFDFYASSGFVLLWIALCESMVIGWVYGGNRYMQDIIKMIGQGWIRPYMVVAWMFITPLFAGTIFIYSLVYYEPLKYENNYVYPWWGYMMGWIMALLSMVTVPILFVYQFVFKSKGSLIERWIDGTTSRVPENQQDKKDNADLELL